MGRTAPLTSKRCILYIYSTNVGAEYFKHALYSPFFFSSKCSLFHNANLFGSCIIHILYTGCAEIKKNNSGAKGLNCYTYGWSFLCDLGVTLIACRFGSYAALLLHTTHAHTSLTLVPLAQNSCSRLFSSVMDRAVIM